MKKAFTLLLCCFCLVVCSQDIVFATISGGDLYSFDFKNCTRHFIGVTGKGFGDMAFTSDGRLWGINNGKLYRIDTSSAVITYIGSIGVHSNNLVGLNDSILLTESGAKLYGINVNDTSATYYIDTIGYGADGDLVWYDDDLYMVTPFVKIALNSTYTSIDSIITFPTVPPCAGAVAATIPGDYNSIVGFSGPDAIRICQLDGTNEMLCPGINPGGTPGAAYINLPVQVPKPLTCRLEHTGISKDNAEENTDIFPNPVTNYGIIYLKPRFNIQATITVRILGIDGRLFFSTVLQNTSQQQAIDLKQLNLVVGMYVMEINDSHKQFRSLLVVE